MMKPYKTVGPILQNCFIASFIFASASTFAETHSLTQAMYFKSKVNDAENCEMLVEKDSIVFSKEITNPAVTCPDAFAWKKLIETIQSEFWSNWAYDNFTYPSKPYPLCTDNGSAKNCCDPLSDSNPGYDNKINPGINCPYYPGVHVDKKSQKERLVRGKNSFKQHFSQAQKVQATIMDKVDPGRVIRQEMAEVVFRNHPMWEYNFRNNLYNTNGLADVFNNRVAAINKNAPYHSQNGAIDFPQDSVMFKTDWLHEDEAKKLGLTQDKENPYITMYMSSPTGDNDANVFREGLHYLMAITAASKDLPNWHWYAIEHVNNPGRCDYIGCNDSFGYYSSDAVPEGYRKNYVAPKTISDGLGQPSPVFVTGKPYPAEKITPELAAVFKKLNVGQKDDGNTKKPSIGDKAWLSYRLKGVQTEFVTNEGIDTVMGNSVTEGGFVNSSSCMTCHSQATVNDSGVASHSIGFSNQMNLIGYKQSSNGIPENSWFYYPGTTTPLNVKSDFVWGILFAQPLPEEK